MEVRYRISSDHEGQELRRFMKGKREFSSALWKRVKWNGKEISIPGVMGRLTRLSAALFPLPVLLFFKKLFRA